MQLSSQRKSDSFVGVSEWVYTWHLDICKAYCLPLTPKQGCNCTNHTCKWSWATWHNPKWMEMNGSKSCRLLIYHGARVSEKKTSWFLDILYRWYALVYCHLVNLPHMFSTRIHQPRNVRSNGQAVMLERTWKRAWHGSSLHRIEEIAQKGLKVGKKGSLGHWKLDPKIPRMGW